MATFARKKLAHGYLSDSLADIYVPGSGVTGLIHNIVLHNTHTSALSAIINYDDNTNDLKIVNVSLQADESIFIDFPGEGLVCINPASIRGNTSVASKIVCTITGSEETA